MARSNFSEELTIRSSFAVSESSLVRSKEVVNSFEGIITSITVPVDNKYLCCYFMADREIDVEALTAYASESLAHYMVPDVFIQLEKMPLTQNGKIDKKALPKPVAQPRNLKEPENPMQKKIFDIVAKVVENDFFGIDTSFYKAGLSSISAMKLCVLISEEFGVTVKTSDIHENNTVEKLEKICHAGAEAQNLRKERGLSSYWFPEGYFCRMQ